MTRTVPILLLASTAFLGACEKAATEDRVVLDRLRAAYPGAQIDSVRPSPIAAVYEVKAGADLLYADASGRYVIFGRMHDMQSAGEPTAGSAEVQAASAASTEALRELFETAERRAIKTVHGNGAAKLYIFSDPMCPHCRSIEPELKKLADVTVYTIPIAVISAASKEKALAAWCAADRVAAWKQALSGSNPPKVADCQSPLDDNLRVARALGVRGTPTILNTEGRMLMGHQPADALTLHAKKTSR